jgi:hypothetical protein
MNKCYSLCCLQQHCLNFVKTIKNGTCIWVAHGNKERRICTGRYKLLYQAVVDMFLRSWKTKTIIRQKLYLNIFVQWPAGNRDGPVRWSKKWAPDCIYNVTCFQMFLSIMSREVLKCTFVLTMSSWPIWCEQVNLLTTWTWHNSVSKPGRRK